MQRRKLGSDVPPGLGLILFGYPRVPLRFTLGYFPQVPSGNVGRGYSLGPTRANEFPEQILRCAQDDSSIGKQRSCSKAEISGLWGMGKSFDLGLTKEQLQVPPLPLHYVKGPVGMTALERCVADLGGQLGSFGSGGRSARKFLHSSEVTSPRSPQEQP